MSRLTWRGILLAAVAVFSLSGCPVPLPPTGYETKSRTNLPDQVPEFIVNGTTTRQEVLLNLGVPDSYAPDGHWFAYRTSSRSGGLLLLVPYGGVAVVGTDEQLLLVHFDSNAVVTDATFAKRSCPHLVPGSTAPCLKVPDPASDDASVELEAGVQLAVFEKAVWALGELHPFDLHLQHFGRILLTSEGILAIANDANESGAPTRYWIPYQQVARADLKRNPARSSDYGLLRLKDGRLYSVEVWADQGPGFKSRAARTAPTRDLIEQINRALNDQGKQD